jgi:hypothetical protein
MTQTIDTLPFHYSERILCGYVNPTKRIQIARITNVLDWYFERVIFPGERLLFETVSEAQLEIYTSEIASAVLADRVHCDRLRINETSYSLDTTSQQKVS